MANYSYKAIDPDGKYIKGKISAENPSDLMSLLKNSSLELITYKEERAKSAFTLRKNITTQELISIFIHLEQLDRAGVSIIDAIQDLRDTTDSSAIKSVMQEIYESIKNGNMFSESIAKRSDIFKSTYVGLIAMGEKTGTLSNAFISIVEDIKWNIEIKRKTKKS